MKLNKLEDRRLGVASRDLALGRRSIKGVSDNLNTLNTTDDTDGDLNTNGANENIGDVLTLSQKKIWNRLNDRQKQKIIDKSEQASGNKNVSTLGTSLDVEEKTSTRNKITSSRTKGTSRIQAYRDSKTVTTSGKITNKAVGVGSKVGAKTTVIGAVASVGIKIGKGFTTALQRGVEEKSSTITQNLQNQQTQLMSGSTAKEIAVLIIVKVALAAVQMVATILTTIIMTLLPVIIAITAFVAVIGLIAAIASIFTSSGTAGNTLVEIAKYQVESQAGVLGGYKYKDWYGMDENWCTMFVTWCADEAGFIEQGIIPKTASVSVLQEWFIARDLYKTADSGYKPKAGDIIIFLEGMSHSGIVVSYDEETDRVTTIEGNSGGSITNPYHIGSGVLERERPRLATTISGYGTPDYPEGGEGAGPLSTADGTTIVLPANLGKSHTYMGWQMITSTTSKQWQLRTDSGMNFDDEGFAIIGERYVIACTTTFGEVGDYIDWYQEDGTVIKSIVGDIKNQTDEGCTEWGHNNGQVVVEFVVNKDTWYGTGHANPGTTSCHPEWKQYITKAINRGNYWGE